MTVRVRRIACLCLFAFLIPGPTQAETDRFWHEANTRTPYSKRALKLDTFRNLSEKLLPSVVKIEIRGPLHVHKGKKGKVHPSTGRGSGFVIHEDGYILTNHHVIGNASQVFVILMTGERIEAEVIGSDPETDIALLRISPPEQGISVARLGDSDEVEVGEWVMAIGHPFGLSHTVTTGIISGLNRRKIKPSKAHRYSDFLQTDAPINKGSSGGPLVDTWGAVVGMNTAINKKGQGISFSIPVNMIKTLLPRLKEGEIRKSWLGVSIGKRKSGDISPGVAITKVIDDSPAQEAGMRAGDILLSFDGVPLQSEEELAWLAAAAGVSAQVEVGLSSPEGEERNIQVTLGERPGQNPNGPSALIYQFEDIQKIWGLDIAFDASGAFITTVVPGTPAAKAGAREGDEILMAGKRRGTSKKSLLRAAIDSAKNHVFELEVRREKRVYYIPMRFSEKN